MSAIVQLSDLAVGENPAYSGPPWIQATFPAYSMTLLVVPEAGNVRVRTPGLPHPVVPPARGGASSREMQ
jgi:hypothetical protein